MTLARTSSGSIKIKTGGGLRAVECACCGGCGCNGIQLINPPDDPNFTKKVLGTDPNIPQFTQVNISWGIHTGSYGAEYGSPQGYEGFTVDAKFENITATWPHVSPEGFLYAKGEEGCGDNGSFSAFRYGYTSGCESYSGNSRFHLYPNCNYWNEEQGCLPPDLTETSPLSWLTPAGWNFNFRITPSGCLDISVEEDYLYSAFFTYNPEIYTDHDLAMTWDFQNQSYPNAWIATCNLDPIDSENNYVLGYSGSEPIYGPVPTRPSVPDSRVFVTINGQQYPVVVADDSNGGSVSYLFSGFVTINFS